MGIDLDGIIEKGQTTDLATKIRHFKGGLFGIRGGDSEGWTLGYIHDQSKWLRDMFGSKEDLLNSTRFTYIETDPRYLRGSECKAIDTDRNNH